MKHFAGLDVSAKETSICVMDEAGAICREFRVPTDPRDITLALNGSEIRLYLIGLKAVPLSQWLHSGLAAAGLPVICIETRHTKAFLKAQINKSDRNGAFGIARIMRVNLFRPVHVKSNRCQRRRALLRARTLLQGTASVTGATQRADCRRRSGLHRML